MTLQGRIFIARHGETVFNVRAQMQGQTEVHTPLTAKGFAQADEMGRALALWLGTRQALQLWSSSAGRALQTMAIITEHLEADWRDVRRDDRLVEIDTGSWSGRDYAEIERESGPFVDRERGLFTQKPPGGEWYDDIARRLTDWIEETSAQRGDRLVVMHGISSRVLRGLLLGLEPDPQFGAPVAPGLPQGAMVMIGSDGERIIATGAGGTDP